MLLTDEMVADYEAMSKMNEEEIAAYNAYRKERFQNKTPEEQEFVRQKTMESLQNSAKWLDEIEAEISAAKTKTKET